MSLLKDNEDIPGRRVLEILQRLRYSGGKSILNEPCKPGNARTERTGHKLRTRSQKRSIAKTIDFGSDVVLTSPMHDPPNWPVVNGHQKRRR